MLVMSLQRFAFYSARTQLKLSVDLIQTGQFRSKCFEENYRTVNQHASQQPETTSKSGDTEGRKAPAD